MNDLLEARDLHKSYLNATEKLSVLKGIDLRVKSGEILSIVGRSGAGKSTLLRLLGTLDRPTSGSVLLDGSNICNLPDSALAKLRNRKIGFVFQFHHLLSEFSALENVMMPALMNPELKMQNSEIKSGALRILELVSLRERADHRPSQLSGGERQRVAVARALANEPALLLGDEPTGNLDRRSAETILELLWRLNKTRGQTMVIVTHNENLARRAHRIIRLVDGKAIEER
jgi:lipoprotein-releasing system ATP-binding protein